MPMVGRNWAYVGSAKGITVFRAVVAALEFNQDQNPVCHQAWQLRRTLRSVGRVGGEQGSTRGG